MHPTPQLISSILHIMMEFSDAKKTHAFFSRNPFFIHSTVNHFVSINSIKFSRKIDWKAFISCKKIAFLFSKKRGNSERILAYCAKEVHLRIIFRIPSNSMINCSLKATKKIGQKLHLVKIKLLLSSYKWFFSNGGSNMHIHEYILKNIFTNLRAIFFLELII